jgi:hypothetical protein
VFRAGKKQTWLGEVEASAEQEAITEGAQAFGKAPGQLIVTS